jgi:hypothetical protein
MFFMSPQKNSDLVTKEYLDQALEKFAIMIQAGFRKMGERIHRLEIRMDNLEHRMDSLEERMDEFNERLIRIESVVLG